MGDFVANLFFGGACFVCRGSSQALLCESCTAELPRLTGERCPRCALPSPQGALCGRCLSDPPEYDATIAASRPETGGTPRYRDASRSPEEPNP